MRIIARLLCSFLLFTTFFSVLSTKTAHAASDLTDEMAAADKRLDNAKVTTNSAHIFVGELLEQWSKQSGVDLSAGVKDFAADETLTVFIKDMPLKNAMRSLWSLFSYRPGAWTWEREGEAKSGFRYVLHQPFAARQVGAGVREYTQTSYEAEVAASIEAMKLTPEERQKRAGNDKDMAAHLNDPIIQNGIMAFAGTLNTDDQKKVLSGSGERDGITKDVSDLGEAGRKFVGDYVQSKRRLNPLSQFADPTKVNFFTDKRGIAVPALVITVGNGTSMEGFSYAGGPGLLNKLAPHLRDLWLMHPDQSTSPQEAVVSARPIASPAVVKAQTSGNGSPKKPQNVRDKTTAFAARLQQISESTNTPIMARLPVARPFRMGLQEIGEPYGQPISAFLLKIGDWGWGMQHKWRDKTLLIAALNRITDVPDGERETWALAKMLHDYPAASPEGVFSTEQMANIASSFSKNQLQNAFTREYTDIRDYPPILSLYDFFRCVGERPNLLTDLRSPAGCIDPTLFAVISKLLWLDTLPPEKKAVAIRIVEKKEMRQVVDNGVLSEFPAFTVTLQALSAQNKVVQSLPLPQRIGLPSVKATAAENK